MSGIWKVYVFIFLGFLHRNLKWRKSKPYERMDNMAKKALVTGRERHRAGIALGWRCWPGGFAGGGRDERKLQAGGGKRASRG
jgi:hypothetical protein